MKVSIIIPVYNAAKTLRRCVDSCLSQNCNAEIICVNDGSSDNSLRILSEYGSRIRVLDQSNSGVVAARNAGMLVAKGEFLYFLDSDDYISPGAIQDLISVIDDETDVVFGDQVVVSKGKEMRRRLLPKDEMTGLEYADYSLAHGQGTIGGKMFRANLCRSLKIDSRFRLNEDLLMNIQMGVLARRVRYVPRVNYYYWWESVGSLSKQVNPNSVASVMGVNACVKRLLVQDSSARWILNSGYIPYTIKNAAQLYSHSIVVQEMSFVLSEARRIFIRHPIKFSRQALTFKSCAAALFAQLISLRLGRRVYQIILILRGIGK